MSSQVSKILPHWVQDKTYIAWERGYKWEAHEQWNEVLERSTFRSLLQKGEFSEVASRAVRIESRTNLLFSFEKMALRDAVKQEEGAEKHLYFEASSSGKKEEGRELAKSGSDAT